jgi:hypothetical protein
MLTITQPLLQQNAHLLLKAPDITICTLCHILPLHVSTRVGHLQGAQCQCLAKIIINYNLLKLC